MNYENAKVSGESHFIGKILPLYLKNEHALFIDVGANAGNYSLELHKHFPTAKILAFEPNPSTFEKELSRIQNKQIEPVNLGISSQTETLTLFDRDDDLAVSTHASIYSNVIEELHQTKTVGIQAKFTSLDEFSEERDFEHINFLKIDTEGHELAAIQGTSQLLEKDSIDLIQVEFNEMNVISRTFFRDFKNLLPNFIAYRLLPQGGLQIGSRPLHSELFGFQNIIFINRKFRPNRFMKPTAQP